MTSQRHPLDHRVTQHEWCATLVLRSATTKPDALALVALVAESRVEAPRTARPRVPLADGAWVEIELPKFGDPPPLALDVYSSVSDDHARLQALALLGRLERETAWSVRPAFVV